MFTGIITDLGRVRRLRRGTGPESGLELTIATAYKTDEIALGASIACSGPCLTVVAVEPGAFAVQASAETLQNLYFMSAVIGVSINPGRMSVIFICVPKYFWRTSLAFRIILDPLNSPRLHRRTSNNFSPSRVTNSRS